MGRRKARAATRTGKSSSALKIRDEVKNVCSIHLGIPDIVEVVQAYAKPVFTDPWSFLRAVHASPFRNNSVPSTTVIEFGLSNKPDPAITMWGDAEISVDCIHMHGALDDPAAGFGLAVWLHYGESLEEKDCYEFSLFEEKSADDPLDAEDLTAKVQDLQALCLRIQGFDSFGKSMQDIRAASASINVFPLEGIGWDDILDRMGEGLEMKHLKLEHLLVAYPKGPPLMMPLCDDGNTRVFVAFVGSKVYTFEMNTS